MLSQVESLNRRKFNKTQNKTRIKELSISNQDFPNETIQLGNLTPSINVQSRIRPKYIQRPLAQKNINSPKCSSSFKFKFEDNDEVSRSFNNTIRFSNSKKENFKSPIINSPRSLNSSMKLNQIVKQVKSVGLSGELAYKEHLFQTFQAMKFIKNIKPIDPEALRLKTVNLPRRKGYENAKTVIFDLDETLVHCCENPLDADIPLTVTFPNGDTLDVGINVRPYARECLLAACQQFEVIVYTASQQCYADEVLDYLDPSREIIHHRLYRERCVVNEGVYIKDLRVIGNRRLKDMLIIDNSAYSFAHQIDNGIPIISWYNDSDDRELYKLIDYLKVVAKSNDVRSVNRQTFHLESFYDDYMHDFMRKEN
ncbi:unnamed protein product [Blepharisma stoltei]|uniref:FCP1 homology domain-containing protein n=1 Tax=Blepharisma stoltei TaxID=1481888 RepID=A0AAU9IE38_9CILI|nr:unnamed protein product [Blepharisma stoltei]